MPRTCPALRRERNTKIDENRRRKVMIKQEFTDGPLRSGRRGRRFESCHSDQLPLLFILQAFSDCWRFPSQPRIPCLKPSTGLRSRGAWRSARYAPVLYSKSSGAVNAGCALHSDVSCVAGFKTACGERSDTLPCRLLGTCSVATQTAVSSSANPPYA